MSPRVSVVIPNYNHSRFIVSAVQSAMSQTLQPSEIVVIDDGSTDTSEELLKPFSNQITFIKQKNQGVASARNNGVSHTTGDFVAFLDADDEWHPEKLENQIKAFDQNEGVGLVHCGYVEIDEDGNSSLEHLDGLSGSVFREMLLFSGPAILGGGSGSLIPRSVFESVGGFDTRLSTSADWDLYFRIASKYEVSFIPKILLRYRIHGSNMHGNIKLMRQDMLLAFKKAFETEELAQDRTFKRLAFSRLHRVLAGSFYTKRDYAQILPHLLKSIALQPKGIFGLATKPFKRLINIESGSGKT